ncbi:carbonic anhydrase 2 isoform X2 [Drosophila navojoa]|uniref:carbonic anhydrase 2 isoform X2 n=1 Tax=Drosophila navojoa TaxID=7232 RepID=UPI000847BDF8|nr:carbonic anhydrase 2 isoform X2 [Drosophila navojoa]
MWSQLQSVLWPLILTFAAVTLAQDFGYGGKHGPEHWGEDYKKCSGKFQSPININVLNVKFKTYWPFTYENFDATPKRVHLTNNGHTVLVTMDFDKDKVPRVKGGPLERKTFYQFEQFHFHWGENDTVGSEDLIDNHAYPAELHVVMRSLDYPDFQSALNKDHGLTVFAFFFQIMADDNPNYREFAEMLGSIDRKGKSVDLPNPLPLLKFLGTNLEGYYTYIGSLTTPPCAEEVVWVDFTEPIAISEYQLSHFRLLTANDDHLKNNFRPTQPLNDRIVYRNEPTDDDLFMPWSSIPFVDADNAAGCLPYGVVGAISAGIGCLLFGLSRTLF